MYHTTEFVAGSFEMFSLGSLGGLLGLVFYQGGVSWKISPSWIFFV